MKDFRRFWVLILLSAISSVLIFSCTKKQIITSGGPAPDGKYDLAFPYGGDYKTLEKVLGSIYLLNSTVYYESYTFPVEDQVKKKDIESDNWNKDAYPKVVFNDFSVGTATIIYFKENRVAVLTCTHVVDFPDTVYTYFEVGKVLEESVVSTVSFKKKQNNFIAGLPQSEDYKILAKDRKMDIAILGKKLRGNPDKAIKVFQYPLGAAKELNWGSLVYVAGFPSGKKMITTGIVSSPNRDQNHDFLLDALFNRGFSGGIVLAIRDGLPNFELVGMVNAVAADSEIFLVPRDIGDFSDFNFNIPYTGDIYAVPRKKINYGISYGISVESIQNFLKRNRKELEDAGFHFDGFFKTETL